MAGAAGTTCAVLLASHRRARLERFPRDVPAGGRDLVLEGERARAVETRSRFVPSADRLLTSASARGASTVAVVLSGMGADGAVGMAAVVKAGGIGFCQEPASAVVASMPESALRAAPGARIVPPTAPAAMLSTLRLGA